MSVDLVQQNPEITTAELNEQAEVLIGNPDWSDDEQNQALELEQLIRAEANEHSIGSKHGNELFALARALRKRLGIKTFSEKPEILFAERLVPKIVDPDEGVIDICTLMAARLQLYIGNKLIAQNVGLRLGFTYNKDDERSAGLDSIISSDLGKAWRPGSVRTARMRNMKVADLMDKHATKLGLEMDEMERYVVVNNYTGNGIDVCGESVVSNDWDRISIKNVKTAAKDVRDNIKKILRDLREGTATGRIVGRVNDGGRRRK